MSEGIVNKDSAVDAPAKAPRTRSIIDFNYALSGIGRFGDITPHFTMEAENNDNLPLNNSGSTRSLNLKAPLMSNIYQHKTYCQVPIEAILPLNWDKIITPPVIGDDVDAENVNCVIANFPDWIRQIMPQIKPAPSEYEDDWAPYVEEACKWMVIAEYFLSSGSLFKTLGMSPDKLFVSNKYANFDQAFDDFFTRINTHIANKTKKYVEISDAEGEVKRVYAERYFDRNGQPHVTKAVSFGWFMEHIRDDFNWHWDDEESDMDFADDLSEVLDDVDFNFSAEYPINLKRVFAYQIVCHHFFSNDKIDYIYSAELYRQLVYNNLLAFNNDDIANGYFTLNGIKYRYDYLSGYNLEKVLDSVLLGDYHLLPKVGNLFRLLFGFNRSLRYLDYFTGGKTRPLAVGDVNVAVNDGYVNAIDMTKGIQKQRFYNFVNRVGRKFEEYMAKINGRWVEPDWHNPIWLAETKETIYAQETDNTAVNPESDEAPRQSTIANFTNNSQNFVFELECDRPSVIIGLTWYDIERFYDSVTEKQNFHVDRFDMFNEFMQYIGDQPISLAELTSKNSYSQTFAYGLRHIEYKTRVNQCYGAIATGDLPGFEFIADNALDLSFGQTISPDYIRSRNCELDPFYINLTGYSYGTYFHFIVKNENKVHATRPMVKNPEIL